MRGSPLVDQCCANYLLSQPDGYHNFSGSWKWLRNLIPESHLGFNLQKALKDLSINYNYLRMGKASLLLHKSSSSCNIWCKISRTRWLASVHTSSIWTVQGFWILKFMSIMTSLIIMLWYFHSTDSNMNGLRYSHRVHGDL